MIYLICWRAAFPRQGQRRCILPSFGDCSHQILSCTGRAALSAASELDIKRLLETCKLQATKLHLFLSVSAYRTSVNRVFRLLKQVWGKGLRAPGLWSGSSLNNPREVSSSPRAFLVAWVWHVSPGLQGQWFNELLCKMTLQMESLLLSFLTPGDLFIPAHHPEQGLAPEGAKKALRAEDERQHMSCEISSSRWEAQAASSILPGDSSHTLT